MGNPFSSRTELLILGLLRDAPAGLYAPTLLDASGGELTRATIHITLGRLEERGFIRAVEDRQTASGQLPRSQYRLTGEGERALTEAELQTAPGPSRDLSHG
jgi:DNA-binding PadR family transcriptional regulator